MNDVYLADAIAGVYYEYNLDPSVIFSDLSTTIIGYYVILLDSKVPPNI